MIVFASRGGCQLVFDYLAAYIFVIHKFCSFLRYVGNYIYDKDNGLLNNNKKGYMAILFPKKSKVYHSSNVWVRAFTEEFSNTFYLIGCSRQ